MIALVWVLAVLALLVTLAACAWMLVRKFVRMLEALGELLVTPALLDGVHRGDPEHRPQPAVLVPRGEVAAAYARLATERRERRIVRQTTRLERARALIASEPRALN